MKVTFNIHDLDDAQIAASQILALVDAFRLVEEPVVEEPEVEEVEEPAPKKRGRSKKEPEPTEDPEITREKLRTLAVERGVVWLRPILTQYGAGRLGDLTDRQVIEVLRDAA